MKYIGIYLGLTMKRLFASKLYKWAGENIREMPWKGEKDPYKIWLSEVILQQTRVEQGRPYFDRFVAAYPTIFDLANAPEDEVMKLWQGLGYYSRARNMLATAKLIVVDHNGQFPHDYQGLLQLKGIGAYTAAAIASFAFGLPHAVVDGNVYRVLSRYFGIDTPIDSTEGKKEFNALASELLDKKDPGAYNQAIMDFGAVHCMPKQPLCDQCLLSKDCKAFQEDRVGNLPVKTKKIKQKTRYFNYFVINAKNDHTYIRKRTEKDIWRNLYEFPMIETSSLRTDQDAFSKQEMEGLLGTDAITIHHVSEVYKQTLTHQKIQARFWEVSAGKPLSLEAAVLVKKEKLTNFAYPKIIDCYFSDKSLYLKF